MAMKLVCYLATHDLTLEAFVSKVGVNKATVLRWRNGQRPSWPSIDRIATATEGKVTAADFMEIAPISRAS